MSTMATKHRVCKVDELPVGQRKIVDLKGRSVGVFNIDGEYHAIRNVCPHELAELCRGIVTGTTAPSKPGEYKWIKDGRIIRCPSHGWEFDITTGQSVFNPHRVRVRSYEVTVESEQRPGEPAGTRTVGENEDDPSLEKYEVTVEDQWIVVHA